MTARIWLVVALGSVATYAIRASFLLFARRMVRVSASTRDALRMIPAAALAALVAPALLRPEAAFVLLGPRSLAGLLALGIAFWTRSVLATIVVGLAAVVGLEALLG